MGGLIDGTTPKVSFVSGGLALGDQALESRVRGDTLFKLFFFTLTPAELVVRDGHTYKLEITSDSSVCHALSGGVVDWRMG
jgi:hypothetical protein